MWSISRNLLVGWSHPPGDGFERPAGPPRPPKRPRPASTGQPDGGFSRPAPAPVVGMHDLATAAALPGHPATGVSSAHLRAVGAGVSATGAGGEAGKPSGTSVPPGVLQPT